MQHVHYLSMISSCFALPATGLVMNSSQSFPVHIPTAPYQSRKIHKDYSKAVKREAEKKA